MNKSLLTNFLAFLVFSAGLIAEDVVLRTIGLFALSGALTNWLAVHMLFEKVPGLYGSGVIPARFEDFKLGIKSLLMEQFFTEENIERFLGSENGQQADLHLAPVIEKVDFSPTFDSLIDVIQASSFGGMLAMVGGTDALEPLREPFIQKMKFSIEEMTRDEHFIKMLRDELESPDVMAEMRVKVESIVQQRLNELTPQLVKEIVQRMIKEHLGWLVVWGGVFGGLIGLLSAMLGL
ncbi:MULTISPECIES: DUF445 domain-containing protein [unclassified Neptuniibacter]|uniref:DUF445 domain-containing protein n=1 Tax=unclassified Neptuniibacter TaxID=2630693 RepID=UPI000C410992|nr:MULTISPECIES: DUF445 domain-containing protein [unclassified Neptuniibacter]MAY42020.1 DUF445 domain-containing protein [Oceanospirillaceae bacterium]|tara:strand:+ start:2306 stop:3013 length:708 start_codon:yes stop_codon:yes gene_type:complete